MTDRELSNERTRYDVALGRDPWHQVLGRNALKLLACDIWSRGFVWAVAATWASLWILDRHPTLPELVQMSLGVPPLLAWLHWAARDQFKIVVDALSFALRTWRNGAERPTVDMEESAR